jgi:hypothetical protein
LIILEPSSGLSCKPSALISLETSSLITNSIGLILASFEILH